MVRAKEGINPFYLQFALRLESTLEQFRKWSTGSSYPAILDEDVAKTQIPVPDAKIQDQVALALRSATIERDQAIKTANDKWKGTVDVVMTGLSKSRPIPAAKASSDLVYSIQQVQERLATLGSVQEEVMDEDFDDEDAEG